MTKCRCGKHVAQATQQGTQLPANTRVFVLSGASHRGKSTTLNKLAHHMSLQSGWNLVIGPNPPPVVHKDHQYLFVNRVRGLKVGIATAGDGHKQITAGFSHFRSNGCNVCFIASKTSGEAIRCIEQECFNASIVPQYQFLPGEYTLRNQNKVQADVVAQLFKMI